MNKLFIVVNDDFFFLSHRLPIALEAKKSGYDVTVLCKDNGRAHEIEDYRLNFIDISFDKVKFNPLNELKILLKLRTIYKREKPVIVHHITLKPIILGSIAAKVNKKIAIVNAVSGLGVLFSSDDFNILRWLTIRILKLAFKTKNPANTIFQNCDDKAIFINKGIVDESQTTLIKGSGVNLKEYSFQTPQINGSFRVLLASRLLYPKGFKELYHAAEKIKKNCKNFNIEFIIAGGLIHNNPSAIKESTIREWEKDDVLKWIGFVKDMKSLIESADLIVFPSYYGEGVPKFLIEACAIGRPIITTEHPGCKECVDHGKNGYLIPVKDSNSLCDSIIKLYQNKELCISFGKKSRQKAEIDFSIETVIKKHLNIYNQLSE